MSDTATTEAGRTAGRGVLLAACVSALVVNANTSAVTILLPAISADVGASKLTKAEKLGVEVVDQAQIWQQLIAAGIA